MPSINMFKTPITQSITTYVYTIEANCFNVKGIYELIIGKLVFN